MLDQANNAVQLSDTQAEAANTVAADEDKSSLPPFVELARTAAIAVLGAIAVAIVLRQLRSAESLAAGLAVCLAMYAGIYTFVQVIARVALALYGGEPHARTGGLMPWFLLAMIGKFFGIGIFLFLLVKYLHVNVLTMLLGFLIAQIAITVACVCRMNATQLWGGRSSKRT